MRAFRLPWALPALAAATPVYLCAQTCPTLLYPDGYGNNGTASCTIPTGTATNRVLADAGTINGNATMVTVLYGNAIQANAGATINLGRDTALGPTRIAEAYGGGGIIGLYALGNGATITTDGLIADMPGSSTAVKAEGGGVIHLNDDTQINIPGAGGGAHVIWATGDGSQIFSDGFVLKADMGGGGDVGVHSADGGYVELNNSTISLTSNGGGETGLLVEGNAGIKASNTTITLDANNAYGAIVRNNSYLTLQGAYFDAYRDGGQGTIGVLISGSGINRIDIRDTTIESTYDALQVDANATAQIRLDNTQALLNGGVLLRTASGSDTTLNAIASKLNGAIVSSPASTNEVLMQSGSDWQIPADSNMSSLTNSASTLRFTPPGGNPTQQAAYKTITTTNYRGVGTNYIDFNTYLGRDNSPSDRLVIVGGTAAGTTYVRVHNTNGPGARTRGNGILLIEAMNGATTNTKSFVQVGQIREGAYNYTLRRGSVDRSSSNSWYLRSGFTVPPTITLPPPLGGGGNGGSGGGGSGGVEPPPTEMPPASGGGDNGLSVDPPPAVLPPGDYPDVGPEIATYSVVQPTARQLGLQSIATMHERNGNTVQASPYPAPDGAMQSSWGRVYGQSVSNHYLAFADPRAHGDIFGAQVGVDAWHSETADNHQDTAGFYVAYTRANLSVDGLVANPAAFAYDRVRTGDAHMKAYAFAGYWTHVGPGNGYLDGILQGTHYTGDARTENAVLSTPGNGFAASLEGGLPFVLADRSVFTIEPQMQVIWQRITFDQRNDGEGPGSPGTTTGTTGRLGVRSQWTLGGNARTVWQPYARLDLWHDWGGRSVTDYGADKVPLRQGASRLELQSGFTASFGGALAVYGQLGYQKAVGSTDRGGQRRAVAGSLGVRYRW